MKTFRKSSLITSVALLLVAIVALGGATFAWFTSDPTATADGLSLKASAASGLEILSATEKEALGDDAKFASSTTLNYGSDEDFALSAVSYNFVTDEETSAVSLGSAFATTAKSNSNYAAADTATVTAGTGAYTEKIYARLSGATENGAEVQLTKVEITATGTATDLKNAVKVAVTYYDSTAGATKLLGVFSLDGADNKYLTTTGTYKDVLSTTTYNFAEAKDGLGITAGDIVNSGNDYFEVTVYLDGEAGTCFTNNAMLDTLISDIDLGFKVVEKEATAG